MGSEGGLNSLACVLLIGLVSEGLLAGASFLVFGKESGMEAVSSWVVVSVGVQCVMVVLVDVFGVDAAGCIMEDSPLTMRFVALSRLS